MRRSNTGVGSIVCILPEIGKIDEFVRRVCYSLIDDE